MIKTAVIGLGNMGRHHARYAHQIPECHLVAVTDHHTETTQKMAKEYNCKAYDYADELFKNESLDAVIIASSTSSHYELSKMALENDCHVFIEKPICETLEQAEEVVALIEKTGKIAAVGHVERFNPAIEQLKQKIEDGELGKITSIVATRAGQLPPQIKDANVIIDLAVHDIDICNDLFGSQPEAYTMSTGRASIEDREDYADMMLKYKGNCSAHIHVNWITPIRRRTLDVTGTKGFAHVDYAEQSLSIAHSHEGLVPLPIEKQENLKKEQEHFFDCIEKNKQPVNSAVIGKDALAIALDMLQMVQ